MYFWHNNSIYPNVNVKEFANKELTDIITRLKANNVKIVIKDVTTDIQVPTFVAIFDCRAIGEPAFVYGSGAHLDPEIAVLRAVTEAFQLRASQLISLRYYPEIRYKKISGLGSDEHDVVENMISCDSYNIVQPMFEGESTSISQYPNMIFESIDDSIEEVVKIVTRCGYEVLYKDISKNEAEFPAVRVLIPGLQPSIGLPSRITKRMESVPLMIRKKNRK